jgi:putative aldouronate transport system permease protein
MILYNENNKRVKGVKNNPYFNKTIIKKDFITNYSLYLLALPIIIYFILFSYQPMYGAIIAFKDFRPGLGISGSPWVGFENFITFFSSYYFWRLIWNTFIINVYGLIFGFTAPIIFALLLNELKLLPIKRSVQTISYFPHFVSMVVIAGLIRNFCSYDGAINSIIVFLGGARSGLLNRAELFRSIYVASGVWQDMGFDSIIYLAAISNINSELYEAAHIDGAGRLRQALNITIPGIMPTVVILLILSMGRMMSVGYEKIILLYNPMTYSTADVISSFVYRKGLLEANYSYSAAIGLFNSVINLSLLFLANFISRRVNETSLW